MKNEPVGKTERSGGVLVGRVRRQKPSSPLTFRITDDAWRVLEAVMAKTGKSQTDVINEALEKAGPAIVKQFNRKVVELEDLYGSPSDDAVEKAAGEGVATAFLSLPEMKREAAGRSGKTGSPKADAPRRRGSQQ